jgi:methylenetetrahydrofolate reductase (NADPH)
LVETAVGIQNRNELPSGRKVAGNTDFFIGVAETPVDPPAHWTPASAKSKIAAGAQFAQTQFCMDGGAARRYMKRLVEEGITERLFMLIGIAPLVSARAGLWIREHLPGSIIPDAVVDRLARAKDPTVEGARICIDLVHEFAEIPGVSGAHLMVARNLDVVAEVIAAARSIVRSHGRNSRT